MSISEDLNGLRLPSTSLLANDLVAIASRCLELGLVQNGYIASRIGDHSRLLQQAGRHADRGSPGPEHLSEELLGQGKSLAANSLVAHQQPTCESLLYVMQAVASGELRRLDTQDHGIALQFPFERRALRKKISQNADIDAIRGSIPLRDDSEGAGFKPKNYRKTYETFFSD
jgi:hypothetical protein